MDAVRATNLASYHRHRGKRLPIMRAYGAANRERIAQRTAAWREANRDAILERKRARYRADPEAHRAANSAYRLAHPEVFRAKSRRRRAVLAGVPREPYDELAIFERDGWECQLCHQPVDPQLRWPNPRAASIDHRIPITAGGPDVPANVQLAHSGCNSGKRERVA